MGRIMRLGSEKLRSRASVALAIPQAVASATCVCRTELRSIEKAVPGYVLVSQWFQVLASGGIGGFGCCADGVYGFMLCFLRADTNPLPKFEPVRWVHLRSRLRGILQYLSGRRTIPTCGSR
jgi:hypothetical protein